MFGAQFFNLITALPFGVCLAAILLARRRANQSWVAFVFFSTADALVLGGVETVMYIRMASMLIRDDPATAWYCYIAFFGVLAKQGQLVGKGVSVQDMLVLTIRATTRLTAFLNGLANQTAFESSQSEARRGTTPKPVQTSVVLAHTTTQPPRGYPRLSSRKSHQALLEEDESIGQPDLARKN